MRQLIIIDAFDGHIETSLLTLIKPAGGFVFREPVDDELECQSEVERLTAEYGKQMHLLIGVVLALDGYNESAEH